MAHGAMFTVCERSLCEHGAMFTVCERSLCEHGAMFTEQSCDYHRLPEIGYVHHAVCARCSR